MSDQKKAKPRAGRDEAQGEKHDRPKEKKSPKETKAARDSLKALKNKLKKKEAECESLHKDLERMRDEYLRTAADMENLRKRLEREKGEFYQYALSEFLRELLGVLDNFERALQSEEQAGQTNFRQGVEMIYKQLRDLLHKQGVAPIEIVEDKFDPHLHQAFMSEESEDVEEPRVGEELQKGYTLHNRLLRPALVKVLVPKKE